MTTYYVGSGGNDGNAGASWALRKATLNGAEDIPVVAGDTVYVGPGVYRETLTVDVSGSAGSPITYIGDYEGKNTDGVGGVVRITGSDDDQVATRAQCINGGINKSFRAFKGIQLDTTTSNSIYAVNDTNWIVEDCIQQACHAGFRFYGANQANIEIRRCVFWGSNFLQAGVWFDNASTVNDAGHLVENCVFLGAADGAYGVRSTRIGGVTIRNSQFMVPCGVIIGGALAVGQIVTVNNCIFHNMKYGLYATALGEIIEDHNTFFLVGTAHTNVAVGANSNTRPPLLDTRWFFEMVGGGTMVTPFDLGAWSQLINVAGTSPPAADMRGTAIIGAAREWGPLEYDTSLLTSGGGGSGVIRRAMRMIGA